MRLDPQLALFGSVLFLAACGGSSHAPATGVAGDSGSPPATIDGSSGVTPQVAAASIGPIDVAAGAEKTVCIVKHLDNADDLVATSFVTDLAPGSHHLILYKSAATAEQTTPFACNPFEGLLSGDVPLVIVTKPHLDYELPSGVGLRMAKGQMVKIEAHYINTSAALLQGSATIAIKGMSGADAGSFQAAGVGVWGTTNINVPARGTFSTPVNFQAGMAGTKMFAMTTHEHHLGTRVQAWSSSKAGDVAHSLADDKDWASPAFATVDPAIAFDGTTGLSYQCDWNNSTDATVSFGESALNEMCFLILYYYPALGTGGTDLCLDGSCKGRP